MILDALELVWGVFRYVLVLVCALVLLLGCVALGRWLGGDVGFGLGFVGGLVLSVSWLVGWFSFWMA